MVKPGQKQFCHHSILTQVKFKLSDDLLFNMTQVEKKGFPKSVLTGWL